MGSSVSSGGPSSKGMFFHILLSISPEFSCLQKNKEGVMFFMDSHSLTLYKQQMASSHILKFLKKA